MAEASYDDSTAPPPFDVSVAFRERSVVKLAELLASGELAEADRALALGLIVQQLHDEEKCEQATAAHVCEICLMLLQDSPSPAVRARAARALGMLPRAEPGAARLAHRTAEGDGAFTLAAAAARDEDATVRAAAAAALLQFVELAPRVAGGVLARAPSALADIAEAVAGGGGEAAVRVLAGACATHEGAMAALGVGTPLPAVVAYLRGGAAGPAALPALAALRSLCAPDRGKADAVAAGAPAAVAPLLGDAAPATRAAAATALAVMAPHLDALQAFLDGPAGEGPGPLAAALLPLLLEGGAAFAAAAGAAAAVGDSERGRAALIAEGLAGGAPAVRALARALGRAVAGDLVDVLRSPLADAHARAAAAGGLRQLVEDGRAGSVGEARGAAAALRAAAADGGGGGEDAAAVLAAIGGS
jgi:hypothetical protein